MKKNKLLFAITFLFITGMLKSQDIIYKINGDSVISKIHEISPTEIKYKRIDNLDGPTYIELKSAILKIKYSNSSSETFKTDSPIETDEYVNTKIENNNIDFFEGRYTYKEQQYSESKIHKILLETKDNKIITLVMEAKRNKRMQYIGFVAIPLGIVTGFSTLMGVVMYDYDPGFSKSAFAVAGVSGIMTIAAPILSANFKKKRTQCNAEAVKLFNERY